MDVLVLIDKLDDTIHNAKPVPLTDQVRVDKEEIYDILDQMRATIPEEIKQARWIVKERQEMLAEAKREAELLVERDGAVDVADAVAGVEVRSHVANLPVHLVVVARRLHPDLVDGADAGGRIETARGDAHLLGAGHLPEQRRAALAAEAPPGVMNAVGAVDPPKPALLAEPDVLEGRRRGCPDMAGPPPAFGAVTQHHVA